MLRVAFRPDIVKRSLVVALLVGTVLNLINQGDQLVSAGSINVLKCLLTYTVPYCVATYGAVSALMRVQ
ncbi:nitrate/nitrite transporter NrtS [Roseovarius aestuarii]|nr:nitrate/nitrite transporter NrtS [Roseovarius aestuarii]